LPIDYQPRSKLEKADFFGFIFQLLFAWVDRGDKKISLTTIMFLNYADRYLLPPTSEYNEVWLEHNQEYFNEEDNQFVNKEQWKEYIIASVRAAENGDDSILELMASSLEEFYKSKQALIDKGYGCLGMGILDSINEIPVACHDK